MKNLLLTTVAICAAAMLAPPAFASDALQQAKDSAVQDGRSRHKKQRTHRARSSRRSAASNHGSHARHHSSSRGRHVVHQLSQGRSAWLHLVQGEVTFGDIVLTTGDGAGVTAERALSLTAREATEILLIDLGGRLPGSPKHEGVP